MRSVPFRVRRRLLPLLLALGTAGLGSSRHAEAKITIVTTVQTFKAIADEIGGDKVATTALVGANVDPHFVQPKPSYALVLNKADLLIQVGLQLEVGWLPPLIASSRNPKIQTSEAGNLDASSCGIEIRDVAQNLSRSQGDVHPMGNPHFWLPPENALKIARCIADRLKQIDGDNAATYQRNAAAFAARVDAKSKEWLAEAKGLRGKQVITYHKSWGYLTSWLGMVELGYVEPKPGVPPDPQHLAQLTRTAKAQGATCVISESFYPQNTSARVAELGGMKLAVIPSDAGTNGIHDYIALMDYVVAQLNGACR